MSDYLAIAKQFLAQLAISCTGRASEQKCDQEVENQTQGVDGVNQNQIPDNGTQPVNNKQSNNEQPVGDEQPVGNEQTVGNAQLGYEKNELNEKSPVDPSPESFNGEFKPSPIDLPSWVLSAKEALNRVRQAGAYVWVDDQGRLRMDRSAPGEIKEMVLRDHKEDLTRFFGALMPVWDGDLTRINASWGDLASLEAVGFLRHWQDGQGLTFWAVTEFGKKAAGLVCTQCGAVYTDSRSCWRCERNRVASRSRRRKWFSRRKVDASGKTSVSQFRHVDNQQVGQFQHVDNQQDIEIAANATGFPKEGTWTKDEIELLAKIGDPALLAEVVRWKRRFGGKLSLYPQCGQ